MVVVTEVDMMYYAGICRIEGISESILEFLKEKEELQILSDDVEVQGVKVASGGGGRF